MRLHAQLLCINPKKCPNENTLSWTQFWVGLRRTTEYSVNLFVIPLFEFQVQYNGSLIPRLSESLAKLATRMSVISRDSMRISICPHYVCIRVKLRTTELTQVKEKPCADVLLYICVYARLKLYVWYGVCCCCPQWGWSCCVTCD